ncbi:hypothetical protein AMJ39_04440 [candidate division TA06 bacterium DG_24]|jgi:diadenosine tetraphosphatase ApaH/serine/threonine PP2A family protein phosphatase|uniref:Calcineurin-like phosphoesterase domain-containing protein n=3 Tax=Bacteria division TA06 TaxID=1156500 RepID=A0A0S8JGF3_UNCT6|nr:MAG: hypothetical protein AMJ39_04440 [candidate division TA06 bacterium DG_24]KPK67902.1 MAG: hypothetical protein AMJ82_09585 [candidate division TA06 bacterium SM23_40]KPL07869.1 MAG: hypothetical protein AMJ71_08765 [candidate division TA06 bacterium SM1_40]
MRYAFISDIHGNLEALDTVLQEIEGASVETIVCLGDLVGYGADPNECVDRVRSLTEHIVVGNHDHAAVGLTDVDYFNPWARAAVIWSGEVLRPENREFLKALPLTLDLDDHLCVHSSPSSPAAWRYVLSAADARYEFASFTERVCLIGHSHVPLLAVDAGGECSVQRDSVFTLRRDYRYIINAGSVGQPRDYDPRACYVIYDGETDRVEFRRVAYDIRRAQEKIIRAGLPPFLAERLAFGE